MFRSAALLSVILISFISYAEPHPTSTSPHDDDVEFSDISDAVLLTSKILSDEVLYNLGELPIANLAEIISGLQTNHNSPSTISTYNFYKSSLSSAYMSLVTQLTTLNLLKVAPTILNGQSIIDNLTWSLLSKNYIERKKLQTNDPISVEWVTFEKKQRTNKGLRFLEIGPRADRQWLNTTRNLALISADSLSEALASGLSSALAVGAYNQLADFWSKPLWEDAARIGYTGSHFGKYIVLKTTNYMIKHAQTLLMAKSPHPCQVSGYFTIEDGYIHHLCFTNDPILKTTEAYLEYYPYLNEATFQSRHASGNIALSRNLTAMPPKTRLGRISASIGNFGGYIFNQSLLFGILASTSALLSLGGSYSGLGWLNYINGESISDDDHALWGRTLQHYGLHLRFKLASLIKTALLDPILKTVMHPVWNTLGLLPKKSLAAGEYHNGITRCGASYCLTKSKEPPAQQGVIQ